MLKDEKKHDASGVPSVVTTKQGTEIQPGCTEEGDRQKGRNPRWEWVEASIWTDNMLTALENGVKGGKWFSLIDKICRPKTLKLAWEKVRANRGAGGVDEVSIDRFEANAEYLLDELCIQLRTGKYLPTDVRRVHIPKGNGETRPLGIPAVRDRIVQMAVKMVIEPIFENEFLPTSHGFRPNHGAKDALRAVDHLLKNGCHWVVDIDFKSFFDTIPHDFLIREVGKKISDSRVLNLLQQFLKQGIQDGTERTVPVAGTPQGAVISPLLANLYLHPLDKLINQDLGLTMIRYADDFVIMAKSKEDAQRAMEAVLKWAGEAGLTVHPKKSRIVDYVQGEGFDFLGYTFIDGQRQVRTKSLKKLKDIIRQKTPRTCGKSLNRVIKDLNKTLRGWYEYFKHAERRIFETLDGMIRRRLRSMLRKREKRPGFGKSPEDNRRWPNAFFAKNGLFCLADALEEDVKKLQALRASQP